MIASWAGLPRINFIRSEKRKQERVMSLMEDTIERLEMLKQLRLTIMALQQESSIKK